MIPFWEELLNFFFPSHCPLCRKVMTARGAWCRPCLQRTLQPHRLALSDPLLHALDGAWALGRYHDVLGGLIRNLKYHQRKSVVPYVNQFLACCPMPVEFQQAPLVVAVPLHTEKQAQRGFNQVELLFSAWLKGQGWAFFPGLERCRQTKPQFGLDARERKRNLHQAFRVPKMAEKMVAGREILLLDDIFTTGTTLSICAEVLKKSGAKTVCALVLASDHG